ncbi:MAG TPA: SDR family oxidoreductase [Ktedonobacteraceae bacterium]|nr:SDR family oxidoreductase [Ktedonobacteraceae bacterium]
MKQLVVLITGASSGIGKATAQLFAEHGHITYVTARRRETFPELQALACYPLYVDLTDEASILAAVRGIETKHSAVDVLVNNAGYSQAGPLEELPLSAMRQQFETNVFGPMRLSQLVLPGMRNKGRGRIITVSSVAGVVAMMGTGAYTMSKHAVECFSDVLRYEVRPFGVNVITIQPGGVSTNFTSVEESLFSQGEHNSPYATFRENVFKTLHQGASSTPLILKPEQVAQVILKAATVPRPRKRYQVGVLAKMLPRVRDLLPEIMWDRLVARMYSMD